jgi:hypothetical protein
VQFTPNRDFWDDDLKSQYCVGLSYAVKDYIDPTTGKVVKAQDCLLFKKLDGWLASGEVRLGGPDVESAHALISGSGTVA